MRAIFISYRRNDSEGEAGRLLDDLVGQFGDDSVFMDVTAIEAGRDFRKAIDESVANCGVLLAIIGNNWVDAKHDSGLRRLDDPADFVRLETASALRRDIPVIPVLVRGAKMPRPEQLPDDLKDLAYRNGVELTHARWGSDLQVLVKALRVHIGELKTTRNLVDRPSEEMGAKPSSGPRAGRRRETKWLALGAGLMVVLALGGYAAYSVMVEREKQAMERQRRSAEDDAARRRAEAERVELVQKKADLERAAAQLATDRAAAEKATADKAAADKAEADRRRDATEVARRVAADKAAADRAAANRAEADRRREATEAARKTATAIAAAERQPPTSPVPSGVKIATAACAELGPGRYRLNMRGTARGDVETVLLAGPQIPPNGGAITNGRTHCSWNGNVFLSDGWSPNPRTCKREKNQSPTTDRKSTRLNSSHSRASRMPSSA